jgi:hypothetical protein
MKFVEPRPFADSDAAARKPVEIASTIEPVHNGRVRPGSFNRHPFGTPAMLTPS